MRENIFLSDEDIFEGRSTFRRYEKQKESLYSLRNRISTSLQNLHMLLPDRRGEEVEIISQKISFWNKRLTHINLAIAATELTQKRLGYILGLNPKPD